MLFRVPYPIGAPRTASNIRGCLYQIEPCVSKGGPFLYPSNDGGQRGADVISLGLGHQTVSVNLCTIDNGF